VWDIATGEQTGDLRHEAGDVQSVALSPDGDHVLTSSDDRKARVWNLSSGALELVVSEVSADAGTRFDPTGKYLLVVRPPAGTGAYEGTAEMLLWRPQDLIDETCRRVTRNLTDEEWRNSGLGPGRQKTCPNLP
jgi:hypothetical protein